MARKRLEGVHFVAGEGHTKTGAARKRKPTVTELRAHKRSLDALQAESDEIRARHGLEPLEPNFYRAAIAEELKTRKPKRKATRKRKVPSIAQIERMAKRHGLALVPA